MNERRALIETLIEALANELQRRSASHFLLEDARGFLAVSRTWNTKAGSADKAHEREGDLETIGTSLVNDLRFYIEQLKAA